MPPLKRNFLQRILGISATKTPADEGSWIYVDGKITVDLKRVPEIAEASGAVRLEGKGCPKRVLLFNGEDGQYHAVCNKCSHAGRRVDPDPVTGKLQCCSVNKSTYEYDGGTVHGPAKNHLVPFDVEEQDGTLVITIP